jgi:uncharacterized membrane protein
MWLIPLGFVLLAIGLAVLMPWIDRQLASDPPFTYSASSAQSTLSAIASGMLVFTGFVFTVLTFAIQFEAGTYTPRLLRSITADANTKVALGVFMATFIYALLVLADVAPGETDYVPQSSVLLAVVMVGVSVLLFLGLLVSVTDSVRSGRVVGEVARIGREVIATMFPEGSRDEPSSSADRHLPDGESEVVANARRGGGVLQAVDLDGIVSFAKESGTTVELVPAVGDFVPTRAPVFRVYGAPPSVNVTSLLGSAAFGDERSFRQDPSFSIRVLVDIAIRALSPAVNDPTTAIEALGRIGDLLAMIGTRRLPDGILRDDGGDVRFLYRTPSWADYLSLSFTEIRIYGADNPLVADELRHMLDELRGPVPPWRVDALDRQVRLLEEAAAKAAESAA